MALQADEKPVTNLRFDPSYLTRFEDKLFIEGPQTRRRLMNFFALLLFATVIATYGLLSNSTATVIGAMIVAPLMGPIIATTAAVVLGSTRRALRAFALTVAGIVTVIAFSYVLSWIIPSVTISFNSNAELASRINPGLFALLTALASGAAGAFIISRAELSDSMGGVAIAISLVPPLCVVGIALREGEMESAGGAMLLFLTNYLAILFAGGVTLWLLGLWRSAADGSQARIRRRGLALFVAGTLVVAVPLTLSAISNVTRLLETNNASVEVESWLEGESYKLTSVTIGERVVVVTIEGSGPLGPVQELANSLATALDRPVIVDLRTMPAQFVSSGGP